jgi:hypothetical protein
VTGPVFHRPEQGPPADAAANLAAWNKLVSTSVERVTSTAEKWRNGLAAFVTTITGLLILKGPEAASEIAPGWNFVVIGLLVAGALAVVVGLWYALEAASPSSFTTAKYSEVIKKYGSLPARDVAVANVSVEKLGTAKKWVGGALLVICLGIVAWWVVPPAGPEYVSVSVTDGTSPRTLCGLLEKSADGSITVRAKDKDAETVPLASLVSIAVVSECPTEAP